jgi:HK97 family phage prohead protease
VNARTLGANLTKQARAHVIKAAGQAGNDLKPGQFSAIVSVFGNIDSYGDVMMPGAFLGTLARYMASGNPVPVIWSHDWQDPNSHIGYVLDAQEVPAAKFGQDSPPGLWVLGQNDTTDNPRAAQVSRLMAGGRITQFSFAYTELNAGPGTWMGEDAWLVHEVELHEVGPTLLGVNTETMLVGAKRLIIDLGHRVKSGRPLDDDDRAALVALRSMLATEPAVDDVTSATKNTDDIHGSTDEATDASNGDGDGTSNLRTDADLVAAELLLAELA